MKSPIATKSCSASQCNDVNKVSSASREGRHFNSVNSYSEQTNGHFRSRQEDRRTNSEKYQGQCRKQSYTTNRSQKDHSLEPLNSTNRAQKDPRREPSCSTNMSRKDHRAPSYTNSSQNVHSSPFRTRNRDFNRRSPQFENHSTSSKSYVSLRQSYHNNVEKNESPKSLDKNTVSQGRSRDFNRSSPKSLDKSSDSQSRNTKSLDSQSRKNDYKPSEDWDEECTKVKGKCYVDGSLMEGLNQKQSDSSSDQPYLSGYQDLIDSRESFVPSSYPRNLRPSSAKNKLVSEPVKLEKEIEKNKHVIKDSGTISNSSPPNKDVSESGTHLTRSHRPSTLCSRSKPRYFYNAVETQQETAAEATTNISQVAILISDTNNELKERCIYDSCSEVSSDFGAELCSQSEDGEVFEPRDCHKKFNEKRNNYKRPKHSKPVMENVQPPQCFPTEVISLPASTFGNKESMDKIFHFMKSCSSKMTDFLGSRPEMLLNALITVSIPDRTCDIASCCKAPKVFTHCCHDHWKHACVAEHQSALLHHSYPPLTSLPPPMPYFTAPPYPYWHWGYWPEWHPPPPSMVTSANQISPYDYYTSGTEPSHHSPDATFFQDNSSSRLGLETDRVEDKYKHFVSDTQRKMEEKNNVSQNTLTGQTEVSSLAERGSLYPSKKTSCSSDSIPSENSNRASKSRSSQNSTQIMNLEEHPFNSKENTLLPTPSFGQFNSFTEVNNSNSAADNEQLFSHSQYFTEEYRLPGENKLCSAALNEKQVGQSQHCDEAYGIIEDSNTDLTIHNQNKIHPIEHSIEEYGLTEDSSIDSAVHHQNTFSQSQHSDVHGFSENSSFESSAHTQNKCSQSQHSDGFTEDSSIDSTANYQNKSNESIYSNQAYSSTQSNEAFGLTEVNNVNATTHVQNTFSQSQYSNEAFALTERHRLAIQSPSQYAPYNLYSHTTNSLLLIQNIQTANRYREAGALHPPALTENSFPSAHDYMKAWTDSSTWRTPVAKEENRYSVNQMASTDVDPLHQGYATAQHAGYESVPPQTIYTAEVKSDSRSSLNAFVQEHSKLLSPAKNNQEKSDSDKPFQTGLLYKNQFKSKYKLGSNLSILRKPFHFTNYLPRMASCFVSKLKGSDSLNWRKDCKPLDSVESGTVMDIESNPETQNTESSNYETTSYKIKNSELIAWPSSDDSTSSEALMKWANDFVSRSKTYTHRFIDSHCHIDFLYQRLKEANTPFKKFREENAHFFPTNYEGCLAVFCNPRTFSSERCQDTIVNLLSEEEGVWFSFGCHPKNAVEFTESHEAGLRKVLSHPKVVSLGEIGLDYSGTFSQNAETQKRVFRKQLLIALELKLPLVIHCRDADDDCLEILQELVPRDYRIHAHCFTRNMGVAERWLDAFPNLFIGLTPLISYRSAVDACNTACHIPLDRLLLETDAPYFVPRSKQRNELKFSYPGFALITAERIAELKGLPVDFILKACRENTRKMYGI
ncbi:uncharacterized protein LOC106056566 [Biomphalaria glabrata]|uniref:Uncharacterized protein LOC106056566 n=1 Tax=Biomphalaria glabrata TaxID=6526 RepID=A0A9U8E182_BIOGL|nr:uncharacterized protein LOC106056566 [Biomphalaria glabrata]